MKAYQLKKKSIHSGIACLKYFVFHNPAIKRL